MANEHYEGVNPLETQVGRLTFCSPLMNASGTFQPDELAKAFKLNTVLGALVTKTVTPQAQAGNPQQRTVELGNIGMLNSIGLQGKGLAHTLDVDMPQWYRHGVPVVLSLSANSVEAFVESLLSIQAHASVRLIQAIELNLSCPNVHDGGSLFGSSPEWVFDVVQAVVQTSGYPIWVKLTPNAGQQFIAVATKAVEAGAEALVAINTVLGAHIDVNRKKLSLNRGFGGYSGAGIQPIALYWVLQLRQAFGGQVPLIGVGGIQTLNDVLAFMMAGCCAVQVGTQTFNDPWALPRLQDDLAAYCLREKVSHLAQLVGCLDTAL
jgi:dihydroorotate dehydrogenase (NAD+) catalytic subunit